MTSRVFRAFPLDVRALVAMTVMSGAAVFAQRPDPAPEAAAAQGQTATAPSQEVVLLYGTPGTHVIVSENTLIRVMTDQSLSSEKSKDGTEVSFTVSEDVIVNHVLAIPRGATVHGEVIQTKKAGRLSGSPELTVKLVSLDIGGESYPLYTYHFRVEGTSKAKPTVTNVEGGAVIGALAGGVISGSAKGGATVADKAKDMAAGAAAGAGVVVVAAAITPRPELAIPAESQMDFHLASPISVQPVSEKEAERLAQRLHPGGPVLYVRGDTP
jgi:hypothetical protein